MTTSFSKSRCARNLPTDPWQSFHTQDRKSKGTGCPQAADELPALYLFLEQGLVLMREAGEPMEFGIFDFCKVFSRAFGEGEDGAGGT